MPHNNISCTQVLFDRKGKVKVGTGFSHIVKNKGEVTSTLNQNIHSSLSTLLCEGTENVKLKQ